MQCEWGGGDKRMSGRPTGRPNDRPTNRPTRMKCRRCRQQPPSPTTAATQKKLLMCANNGKWRKQKHARTHTHQLWRPLARTNSSISLSPLLFFLRLQLKRQLKLKISETCFRTRKINTHAAVSFRGVRKQAVTSKSVLSGYARLEGTLNYYVYAFSNIFFLLDFFSSLRPTAAYNIDQTQLK